MAILIPSKNIYGKTNPIILDNAIKTITAETTSALLKQENDVFVYNDDFVSFKSHYYSEDEKFAVVLGSKEVSGGSSSVPKLNFPFAYASYNAHWDDRIVYVPFQTDYTSLITSIKSGENIKFTVHYKKTTGKAKINATVYTDASYNYESSTLNIVEPISQSVEEVIETHLLTPSAEIPASSTDTTTGEQASVTARFSDKYTTIPNDGDISKGTKEFNFNLVFCYRYRVTTFQDQSFSGGFPSILTNGYSFDYTNENGTYTEYVADKIEMSLNGDCIKLDLQDSYSSFTNNENSQNPFILERNELVQSSATVLGENLSEHNANKILLQYGNGKETALLTCDISDYYQHGHYKVLDYLIKSANTKLHEISETFFTAILDEDNGTIYVNSNKLFDDDVFVYVKYKNQKGIERTAELKLKAYETKSDIKYINETVNNLKVSSAHLFTKMLFYEGDKVVPMALNSDGVDIPMSKYKDGSPKVFEVTGTKIIYDGAIFQKLTLQEVLQEG
jgi:hypothetical protein